ncbi:GNAT family N-acetyltransferase [Tumebacillus flagellatus]|uniref:N-acetyltransferase domain-containing protein n=1 Tax=Tumebacillus flagellatus TaxID=1157490 RepID=A0A074LP66_9BACL|nr:GNAT family protein [Tumebacillus flagellatus]KEO82295.1 hypothetical protein EL26_16050 [Tumebacillus flagellatus]
MKLTGNRVYLRPLTQEDVASLVRYHERNQEFFVQFEPTRPGHSYSGEAVVQQIERAAQAWDRDEAYLFGVFSQEADELVGRIGINFVRRGPQQSGMIGYSIDQAQNGKGLGSEAVRLCTGFGFEQLGLHRMEAGIMPINTGSKRLVAKAGYQFEGIHRKSLLVQEVWVDLEHWAILDEDWERLNTSQNS